MALHDPTVRVGERNLVQVARLHQLPNLLERALLLSQRGNLLLQVLDSIWERLLLLGLLRIVLVQLLEVASQPLVNQLPVDLEALGGVVPLHGVHRPELAPVDGRQPWVQKPEPPTEFHHLPKHQSDLIDAGHPEVGDGLEVGSQLAHQPDHLEVPMTLSFQLPTGTDSVEVAVEVELQQIGGVVRGSTHLVRFGVDKPHLPEVQAIDEGIDEPNRVLLGNIVVEDLWEKQLLTTVRTRDEAAHRLLRRGRSSGQSSSVITRYAVLPRYSLGQVTLAPVPWGTTGRRTNPTIPSTLNLVRSSSFSSLGILAL